jgi:hypothetical protein
MRLNGAYFSRAIFSQVSGTEPKVSRERSTKRAVGERRLTIPLLPERGGANCRPALQTRRCGFARR